MSLDDVQQERKTKALASTKSSVGSEVTAENNKTTNARSSIRLEQQQQNHFILSSKRHDRVGNNSLIMVDGRNGNNPSIVNGSGVAGSGATGMSISIGTKPTLIEKGPMRFLIMDAPRQANMHLYIKEMRKNYVTDVVRVCEPTYRGDELQSAGICLHEMEYKDGTSPSKEIIMAWLQLVEKTFYNNSTTQPNEAAAMEGEQPHTIGVHCVAGLGRAPVMVAIALIEFGGMDPVEAVRFIRNKRRGAINEKQLLYLEGYKKQYKQSNSGDSSCCVIL